MTDHAALIEALDGLAASGFVTGPQWDRVHDLCQAHEGHPIFDWAHALCHRVEGDEWNAAYWYRRAGKPVPQSSLADEWSAMRAELCRAG